MLNFSLNGAFKENAQIELKYDVPGNTRVCIIYVEVSNVLSFQWSISFCVESQLFKQTWSSH